MRIQEQGQLKNIHHLDVQSSTRYSPQNFKITYKLQEINAELLETCNPEVPELAFLARASILVVHDPA